MRTCIQINPDPSLSADPEIDILKTEDGLPNGNIDDYYDEEELGESAAANEDIKMLNVRVKQLVAVNIPGLACQTNLYIKAC